MPITGIDQLNVLVIDDNAYRELTLHPINLIFVDLEMVPDSGLDFVVKVRTAEDSPNPCVPIIMLTDHADKEHVMAARDVAQRLWASDIGAEQFTVVRSCRRVFRSRPPPP